MTRSQEFCRQARQEKEEHMQYDVVVIGGGSAGCVLATRLTEDSQRSVLLLEAGPDYPDLERYPDDLKYGYDQTASAVDAPHNWSFVGTPTPQQGASMPVPRGRVVGGSSAINGPEIRPRSPRRPLLATQNNYLRP